MESSRRRVLSLGGVLAGSLGGCLQFTDPSDRPSNEELEVTATQTPTPSPAERALEGDTLEWLGSAAENSFGDRTGQATATVSVGTDTSNEREFDPAVLRISTGTTVRWAWTGEGGTHNIFAASEAFDSGAVSAAADATFEHTFETAGTYRYYCQPHEGAGARGVVVVESE
ncbi:halocyanin domain-containing protein [Halorientalis halophila]|uniref:halocyanin domain-containing protein n=1 Tax=Halorientalis halophila TaxID=3108499 RepID=UPI00300BDDEC